MKTTTLEEYRIAYPRSASVKTLTQSNMLRVLMHRRQEREVQLASRNARAKELKNAFLAPWLQLWAFLTGRRSERELSPA